MRSSTVIRSRRLRAPSVPLLLAAAAVCASAQEKERLTYEVLYESGRRIDFDGRVNSDMTWLDDGEHYTETRDGKRVRVNAATDEATPWESDDAVEKLLAGHPDFDAEAARRFARRPAASSDVGATLINRDGKVYAVNTAAGTVRQLSAIPGEVQELSLSPHGRYAVYVEGNDLYSVEVERDKRRRLTDDGTPTLLNGILDWVYQEEIYGRGNFRGYWVSPDDEYVAYLQLDESPVPVYTIVNQVPHHPPLEQTNYPKAGDPNPLVRLGVVRTRGGSTEWMDLGRYADIEFLISAVYWAPDGRLLFCAQDREQRWLDLNEAEPRSGRTRVLIHETTPAWVEPISPPRWLADGTFLWQSERDGYRHLYHYAADGSLIRKLTSGPWEIRTLHGVDEGAGLVYFEGTRDSSVERNAYRVPLAGGEPQRLTEPGSNHRVDFDPKFRYFFDTYSNVATPSKVALRRADGTFVRMIDEARPADLEKYHWSVPEMLEVPASDGFLMNATLIKPVDFDPSRKYPVWVSIYAGPAAQTVHNRWGGTRQLFLQMLANEGYVVWLVDPRSGSGKGAVWSWQCYMRMGLSELSDIEDSVRWLCAQGFADPDRVGITGHSYGGYMTSFALTHSTAFKVGIAGAPVTDWRNYDTIYTERYMRKPENNEAGYDAGSVVQGAEDLHGRLLVIHGLLDDNVHFQNTAQLLEQLHRHEKLFDLMVYPRDRHGIGVGRDHYRKLQWEFIRDNL